MRIEGNFSIISVGENNLSPYILAESVEHKAIRAKYKVPILAFTRLNTRYIIELNYFFCQEKNEYLKLQLALSRKYAKVLVKEFGFATTLRKHDNLSPNL